MQFKSASMLLCAVGFSCVCMWATTKIRLEQANRHADKKPRVIYLSKYLEPKHFLLHSHFQLNCSVLFPLILWLLFFLFVSHCLQTPVSTEV